MQEISINRSVRDRQEKEAQTLASLQDGILTIFAIKLSLSNLNLLRGGVIYGINLLV